MPRFYESTPQQFLLDIDIAPRERQGRARRRGTPKQARSPSDIAAKPRRRAAGSDSKSAPTSRPISTHDEPRHRACNPSACRRHRPHPLHLRQPHPSRRVPPRQYGVDGVPHPDAAPAPGRGLPSSTASPRSFELVSAGETRCINGPRRRTGWRRSTRRPRLGAVARRCALRRHRTGRR